MSSLLILIPVALLLGGVGLAAFFWALKTGQFDDMDGAAQRMLLDDDLSDDGDASDPDNSARPQKNGAESKKPPTPS